MSENMQGKVVPFALSATRIRRRADEHAKHGRTLEAIELYRRAAQEDGMPTGWLYLARLLRSCGSHEQALTVLYRMVSHDDAPVETWLELAKNQRVLGFRDGVRDSLYHLLDADPYADAADEARDMLAELDMEGVSGEPLRLSMMVRRAIHTWYRGKYDLAQKRFRRAMMLSSHPGQIAITFAMLCLASPRRKHAIHWALYAMRHEPESIRVRTMACVCIGMQGARPLALGILERCMKNVQSAEEENMFLSAADTLGAHGVKRRFLLHQLQRRPYRAEMLLILGDEYIRQGRLGDARRIWETVLRIDPENVKALLMKRLADQSPEVFDQAGQHERTGVMRLELKLAGIIMKDAGELSSDTVAPGGESRMALDWCFGQQRHRMRALTLERLAASEDTAVKDYLTGLLTSPNVHPDARQEIIIRLAEKGGFTSSPILMGQCIATAQAAQTTVTEHAMRRRFLLLVLLETRRHMMSGDMVAYAAHVWQRMTHEMRLEAAGQASYAYVKAVEIAFLHSCGMDEQVQTVIRKLKISRRRIARVLARMTLAGVFGEGETSDEVH